MLRYYRHVIANGVFYGLVRRDVDRLAPPLENRLANDWLYIATLAFLGEVHTLDAVGIHRGIGMTESFRTIAHRLGLSRFESSMPYVAIAHRVFDDIARSDVYAPLGRARRLLLASACGGLLLMRFAQWEINRRKAQLAAGSWRRRGG